MILAFLLALAAALSGCSAGSSSTAAGSSSQGDVSSQGVSPGPDEAAPEETPEQRTSRYLEELRSEKYGGPYEQITPELREAVPEEDLAASWQELMKLSGPYEAFVSQQTEQLDGQTNVVTVERYSMQSLRSVFTYDAEGRLSGIHFSFEAQTAPYEPLDTDLYIELPIEVGGPDEPLSGLLTLPKGVNRPPVAVLIQGSGPSDYNESIGPAPNRPFADLAHGLALQGVATLRYNKRFFQYPPEEQNFTVEQEVTLDAAEAIRLMASDERVDGSRVFLIGHSLGGMLAPRIAAENPQVRGIVSLAGTLRPLQEVIYSQNLMVLDAQGVTGPERQAALDQLDAEMAKLDALGPDSRDTILGQPASYWSSLARADPAQAARDLQLPMLILQGENDFQVSSQTDYPLWREILGDRENVTYRLYPGLSHLFMPAPDASYNPELYVTPAHMDEQVARDIAGWIGAMS